MDRARELQKALLRASNQIVSKFGIAGVKFVMDQRGYRGGNPRLPLQPLTDEHKSRISSVLASIEQPIMASA
jgi:dihydrodipicolinate synthase/N-acetylneuraminate lyase